MLRVQHSLWRRQKCKWTHGQTSHYIFSTLKYIPLLLRTTPTYSLFLRENEIVPLDIKWIKVKISSGASVKVENCLFSRRGGVVVRWLNLKKTSNSLEQKFLVTLKKLQWFCSVTFTFFFFFFPPPLIANLGLALYDKALIWWDVWWVITMALIFKKLVLWKKIEC